MLVCFPKMVQLIVLEEMMRRLFLFPKKRQECFDCFLQKMFHSSVFQSEHSILDFPMKEELCLLVFVHPNLVVWIVQSLSAEFHF